MKRSNLFATSSKETEANTDCRSEELSIKAGLIHNYGAGTFGFTHLGKKVLDNIEKVIREEMNKIGQEVTMHILQQKKLWEKSGRWKNFEGDEFFTLKNRDGKKFTLAATHEEASVELLRKYIRSYRDLDTTIYQIGRKYRDDRARKGLLRAKEFLMKDAYSFHSSNKAMQQKYQEFLETYQRIFDRLGLEYSLVKADTGSMGGDKSHEFIAEADVGSDSYMKCRNCLYGTKEMEKNRCEKCGEKMEKVKGIEIGHCFQLATYYSDKMDLTFQDENGKEKKVLMACYGIGVTRLISAIIEQNNDEKGIKWNQTVSGFDASIIVARHEDKVKKEAEKIYRKLKDKDLDILLYDNDWSAGEQFNDSDLLGISYKVILGEKFLEDQKVEIETREGEKKKADSTEIAGLIS